MPRLAGAGAEGADVLAEGAVLARWRMSDGARLTIALNIGDQEVHFAAPDREPIFALGHLGAPASFAAWIA